MRDATARDYRQRLLKVLVHIQRNLDADLRLEELSTVANFSPYHFHRMFRGMVGESVAEHVRRLRLERAATRLKHSERSIVQIALEASYDSHEAFTRAFRSMCGVTPSAFRSGHGAPRAAACSVHWVEDAAELTFSPHTEDRTMEVKIEALPDQPVAFVRHTGPYGECGPAWDTLGAQLGSQGLVGSDTRFIGLCHDDPEVTAPDKLRYDACMTVGEDFEPNGEVGVQTIAGGDYAVTTHFGPYDELGDTYAWLYGQWLPQSGRSLRPIPCLEMYLNDPDGTEPEDLITDIYAPLEPNR